jgi:hypothetical protein
MLASSVFILLCLCSLFAPFSQAGRLTNRWRIESPKLYRDGDAAPEFEMEYTVSDFIQLANVKLQVFQGSECGLSISDSWKTEMVPAESCSTAASQGIIIKLQPTISEPTVCVRFGLYTGPSDSNDAVEVNFKETVVQLTIEGDDSISNVSATDNDPVSIELKLQKGSLSCSEGNCEQSKLLTKKEEL